MPSTPTSTPHRPHRPHRPRRSRAYRLTRRAILAALFGVIATYAVAWAAVIQTAVGPPARVQQVGQQDARWLFVDKTQWWGFTHYQMMVNAQMPQRKIQGNTPEALFSSCSPSYEHDSRWSNPQAFADSARHARAGEPWPHHMVNIDGPDGSISLIDAGFPLKAVTCWTYLDQTSPKKPVVGYFGALNLSSIRLPAFAAQFGDTLLPYTPIWPNFLACVALYGFGPWLLFERSTALRRLLRRHRGLCTQCRYDLRGLPPTAPCPECGLTR